MAQAEMHVTATHELGITVVRPGDTLIVAHNKRMSADEGRRYRAAVMERLPGLADVVVLSDVSTVAVYRPDGMGE